MKQSNFEKQFKNKKVLITGHTGFKGSWLTAWLISLGAKVTDTKAIERILSTNRNRFFSKKLIMVILKQVLF